MKKILAFLVALALALSFIPCILALAVDNVYSNSFEDNNTTGWYTPWNGSISLTTEEAYSGTTSLKISNRITSWDSPSINFYDYIRDTGPGKYQLSAYIMTDTLSENNVDNFARLLLRGESGTSFMNQFSGNYYCAITAAARLEEGQWTHFIGTFDVKSVDILSETGLVYFAIDLLAPVEGQNVYFDNITLSRTIPYHETFAIVPKEMVLDVGEYDYLTANVPSGITYTSSNPNIATVDSSGKVVAISPGIATITARYNSQNSYCTVFVTEISEGTYFLRNSYSDRLLQVFETGDNEEPIELRTSQYNEENSQKWTFSYVGYEGFIIRSVSTNKVLTLDLESEKVELADYTGDLKQYWCVNKSEGKYAIKPIYKDDSNNDLHLTLYNNAYITVHNYSDNLKNKQQWEILTLSIPTSGYELPYSTISWIGYPNQTNNCYSYILNNQVVPGTNTLYERQDPGAFYNANRGNELAVVLGNDPQTYADNIINAVTKDFEKYNQLYNTNLVFMPIGRNDVCPVGTYKVALAVSSAMLEPDVYGNIVLIIDYHWYRQDSDGYWSHKKGLTNVTNRDELNLRIVDPSFANNSIHTKFIGYFAITPWNNLWDISNI